MSATLIFSTWAIISLTTMLVILTLGRLGLLDLLDREKPHIPEDFRFGDWMAFIILSMAFPVAWFFMIKELISQDRWEKFKVKASINFKFLVKER